MRGRLKLIPDTLTKALDIVPGIGYIQNHNRLLVMEFTTKRPA